MLQEKVGIMSSLDRQKVGWGKSEEKVLWEEGCMWRLAEKVGWGEGWIRKRLYWEMDGWDGWMRRSMDERKVGEEGWMRRRFDEKVGWEEGWMTWRLDEGLSMSVKGLCSVKIRGRWDKDHFSKFKGRKAFRNLKSLQIFRIDLCFKSKYSIYSPLLPPLPSSRGF